MIDSASPIPSHEVFSSGISQNQQMSFDGLSGNQESGSLAIPEGMRTVLTDKRAVDSFWSVNAIRRSPLDFQDQKQSTH